MKKHNEEKIESKFDVNEIITIMTQCYNTKLHYVLPLYSSTIKLPKGIYPKHILTKARNFTGNAVEIICGDSNSKVLNILTEMKSHQKTKLLTFFENRKQDFELFFNPIKLLLPNTLEEEEINDKRIMRLNEELDKEEIEYVICLKELVKFSFNICIINKKEEEKSNDILFFKYWEKYSGFVLHAEKHFKAIIDSINELSEELLATLHYPRYSIYRILVAIFIKFYYKPLKHKCRDALLCKVEGLNKYIISFYKSKFSYEKLDDDFLKSESAELAASNNTTHEGFVDYIRDVSDCVIAILSMYLNELNVHYIDLSDFLERIGNPEFLVELVESIGNRFLTDCDSIEKEKLDEPHKQELIGELLCQYEKIFPSWFLFKIKERVEKIEFNIRKPQIEKLIDSYKFTEENNPTEEDKDESMSHLKESEILTALIKELYVKGDKTLDEEKMNLLKNYIIQKAGDLIQEMEEKELKKGIDKLAESATIERNESTCGPLTPDTNSHYAI